MIAAKQSEPLLQRAKRVRPRRSLLAGCGSAIYRHSWIVIPATVRSHVFPEYRPRRLALLPRLFNRITGLLKARNRRTHLAFAARAAIWDRFRGPSAAALATPPFSPPRRPSVNACGFFAGSAGLCRSTTGLMFPARFATLRASFPSPFFIGHLAANRLSAGRCVRREA